MRLSLRKAAGMAFCGLLAVILPLTAVAATFEVVLEQQVVRGEEDESFNLGTFDVPEEVVGQTCSVVADGNNNTSVHPESDIAVTSVNTVMLLDVEGAPDKTTTANGQLELGPTVSFTLTLGPDGVYSAGFTVQLDCEPPPTTTTEPPTTTTTEPPTTTTTEPPTTTTEPPPTTTTTTEPPTTTTTPPEATTTTSEPEVSPTTVAQTSTTEEADETDETLPFTGADTDDMARIAYVALAIGAGLLLLTRRSVEED